MFATFAAVILINGFPKTQYCTSISFKWNSSFHITLPLHVMHSVLIVGFYWSRIGFLFQITLTKGTLVYSSSEDLLS